MSLLKYVIWLLTNWWAVGHLLRLRALEVRIYKVVLRWLRLLGLLFKKCWLGFWSSLFNLKISGLDSDPVTEARTEVSRILWLEGKFFLYLVLLDALKIYFCSFSKNFVIRYSILKRWPHARVELGDQDHGAAFEFRKLVVDFVANVDDVLGYRLACSLLDHVHHNDKQFWFSYVTRLLEHIPNEVSVVVLGDDVEETHFAFLGYCIPLVWVEVLFMHHKFLNLLELVLPLRML